MSVPIAEMSGRQMWIGMVKVALLIVVVLLLGAVVLNALLGLENQFGGIGVTALMFAFGMSILANGFLAILRIIDWFEARKMARVNG